MACSRFGLAGRNQVSIDPAFANSPARPRSRLPGKRSPPAAPGWNDAPLVRTDVRSCACRLHRVASRSAATTRCALPEEDCAQHVFAREPKHLRTHGLRGVWSLVFRAWPSAPGGVGLAVIAWFTCRRTCFNCASRPAFAAANTPCRIASYTDVRHLPITNANFPLFQPLGSPGSCCHLLLNATPMMAGDRPGTVLLPGAAPSPSFASRAPAAHARHEQTKADPIPHGHLLPGYCSIRSPSMHHWRPLAFTPPALRFINSS